MPVIAAGAELAQGSQPPSCVDLCALTSTRRARDGDLDVGRRSSEESTSLFLARRHAAVAVAMLAPVKDANELETRGAPLVAALTFEWRTRDLWCPCFVEAVPTRPERGPNVVPLDQLVRVLLVVEENDAILTRIATNVDVASFRETTLLLGLPTQLAAAETPPSNAGGGLRGPGGWFALLVDVGRVRWFCRLGCARCDRTGSQLSTFERVDLAAQLLETFRDCGDTLLEGSDVLLRRRVTIGTTSDANDEKEARRRAHVRKLAQKVFGA